MMDDMYRGASIVCTHQFGHAMNTTSGYDCNDVVTQCAPILFEFIVAATQQQMYKTVTYYRARPIDGDRCL